MLHRAFQAIENQFRETGMSGFSVLDAHHRQFLEALWSELLGIDLPQDFGEEFPAVEGRFARPTLRIAASPRPIGIAIAQVAGAFGF